MAEIDLNQFKQCPCCNRWLSAREIIESPDIELNGMAFDDEELQFNVLYFTHRVDGCNSTFTIPVLQFEQFITEPISNAIKVGTSECEEHCVKLEDHHDCKADCKYAPFRRFMRMLLSIKGQSSSARITY